jgi:hypothetical protein
MSRDQFFQGATRFIEKRASRFEFGLLPEQGHTRPGMAPHLSDIGLIQSRENAQQRCLAHSVGTDQAHTLTPEKLKTELFEQRTLIKAPGKAGTAEQ